MEIMCDKNDAISTKDLPTIREQISALDCEGMALLKARLALSSQVGRLKQKENARIIDPARETAVIQAAQQCFDPSMKHKVESIMSTIMRISRESQYEILMEKDPDWQPGKAIKAAKKKIPAPRSVSFLGSRGSYSHLAAAKIFPDSTLVPAQTFEETCRKVTDGECDLAILPLENTTAGTVNDVVDLLMNAPVYIIKAFSVPIRHKLVLLPGSDISKVRTVLSHPQALAQCSKFIRKMGWSPVAVENTALAARQMIERNDPSFCAIASNEAALLNALDISDESICDSIHNQTRFIMISNTLVIPNKAERISITFRLSHQTGSLAFTLNLFAERGLNLTKIQSRPVPDRPWEYSFWVDLVAKPGDLDAMLALYQLSNELPFMKLMGWYEETNIEV